MTVTVTAHIRRTLAGTKPLYVAAGAGDLAVRKLRSGLAGLRSDLRDEPKAARDRAETLRHDVGQLTHKTEEFARGQLGRAAGTYDDLADRGARLVGRIRRQKATHELVGQADATVRRARATRNAPRKSTAPGARTGRTTVAKARKTAGAAATAGPRAAKKIGD